jgi:hypothetical protein
MDLRQIGWEGSEWIHLPQDRNWWWAVVNVVINFWVLASVLVSVCQAGSGN